MKKPSIFEEIESFLFRPIAVSTFERIMITGGCFLIGSFVGWQYL
jgi:hypothetical protein